MTVWYCQRCGFSQLVGSDQPPAPCQACASPAIEPEHPRRRIPGWRWPGYSAHDRALLAEAGIAATPAPYGVRCEPGGWWVVVDEGPNVGRPVVVVVFGPGLHRDAERQARRAAEDLNRRSILGMRP